MSSSNVKEFDVESRHSVEVPSSKQLIAYLRGHGYKTEIDVGDGDKWLGLRNHLGEILEVPLLEGADDYAKQVLWLLRHLADSQGKDTLTIWSDVMDFPEQA